MGDHALDRVGETGHHRGAGAIGDAVLDRKPQPLDRALQFAAAGGRAVAGVFLDGGGEPVFQVGVEPVLRLARLQIEKAKDQRAGQTEQRRRERGISHAAERGGEPPLSGCRTASRHRRRP